MRWRGSALRGDFPKAGGKEQAAQVLRLLAKAPHHFGDGGLGGHIPGVPDAVLQGHAAAFINGEVAAVIQALGDGSHRDAPGSELPQALYQVPPQEGHAAGAEGFNDDSPVTGVGQPLENFRADAGGELHQEHPVAQIRFQGKFPLYLRQSRRVQPEPCRPEGR
mgnify:CR=1 FL=1